jgi:hypothetical protein
VYEAASSSALSMQKSMHLIAMLLQATGIKYEADVRIVDGQRATGGGVNLADPGPTSAASGTALQASHRRLSKAEEAGSWTSLGEAVLQLLSQHEAVQAALQTGQCAHTLRGNRPTAVFFPSDCRIIHAQAAALTG